MILLIGLRVYGQSIETVDLQKYFGNYTGTFVLFDQNDDEYFKYNPARAGEGFSPASTFKIPNSLIALETGIISDENYVIQWDSVKREFESWNRDHDLRSAIEFSVVPYYQELARRIGEERMKEYVAKLNYGNMDISGGIDRFWLDGAIRISADEQIEFLKNLFNYKLPVSKRNIDIVKDILIKEKTDKYIFSGKTGTNVISNGGAKKNIAWYVGYVEQNDNVYFFALNFDSDKWDGLYEARVDITQKILNHFGLLK